MTPSRFLLVCASLIAAPAVLRGQLPSVTLPTELERVLRDYERAWQAGDAAAVSLLFAEDGFVLSNGEPAVRGRPAIRAAYQQAVGGPLRLRALGFAVDDTIGYIIGAYGYSRDPDWQDTGKFILALRRAPVGPWLIAGDIDNTNRRPERRPGP